MIVLWGFFEEASANIGCKQASRMDLQTIEHMQVSEPFHASYTRCFLSEVDSLMLSYTQCPHSKIAPRRD